MDKGFDIQEYMTKGVERIVADAIRSTLKEPRESAFMMKFAAATKKASNIRAEAKKRGEHIPPFLIASITSRCNLHCAGCYSRCNNATTDSAPEAQMTAEEWKAVFEESERLGISFILLAGGEPLLRKDVIDAASQVKNILFPVFTNGTFIGDAYLDQFDKNRNLVPVTDDSEELAPGDKERELMNSAIARNRQKYEDIVFVSFPGDEKSSGGCIAAGRGFFHINSHGGAEPCPFSPYSDINVRDTSVREALKSGLFEVLRAGDYLKEDHSGGCILYKKRAEVEQILAAKT